MQRTNIFPCMILNILHAKLLRNIVHFQEYYVIIRINYANECMCFFEGGEL